MSCYSLVKMHEHPILLRMLDRYVRQPVDGTWVDKYVFSPPKKLYLDTLNTHRMLKKYETRKHL